MKEKINNNNNMNKQDYEALNTYANNLNKQAGAG